MFNGGQQQQQQQQQQQHRSGASQFSTFVDTGMPPMWQLMTIYPSDMCMPVQCSHYLCPMTLDCADHPSQCPCPYPEDIKCVIPDMDGDVDDATVMCVRGQQECAEVERLMKKYSNKIWK
jgi:hypothetical protein